MPKSDGCPEFSKYLYFSFAPTLVYRDEYPRTRSTNWKLVASHFGEVFACIIYCYCLFDRFVIPRFREVKIKELDFKEYVYLTSICILPAALLQIMGNLKSNAKLKNLSTIKNFSFKVFFSFLHSWHNVSLH